MPINSTGSLASNSEQSINESSEVDKVFFVSFHDNYDYE